MPLGSGFYNKKLNGPCAPPELYLYTFLRNGTGSTSTDMHINGSVTPVNFKYTMPEGKAGIIARVNVHIQDGSVDPSDFGGINGGITNGVSLKVFDPDDTEIIDFMDGHPVVINSEWTHQAGVDMFIHTGAGDDSLSVRWTLSKVGASLYLTAGQYIQLTVSDDLSSISEFHIFVQGIMADA